MKQLSIKLRVTLWFTLLMLAICAASLAFLIGMSERIVASGSLSTLTRVVEDGLSEIEVDDGALEIDDDLDFFQDGVYVTVFDASGRLLYGRTPSGFEAAVPFADGQAQTVHKEGSDWYIYDAFRSFGKYGSVWVRGVASSSEAGKTTDAMLRLAMIALPFLVLIAALGGYALVNRAFRPVRQITATAEHIANGADLSARIRLIGGSDEIYSLAAAFDRMFDRLQASFETERQFTSDASHELRTPIAVIIAQCEAALDHAETLAEAKDALNVVLSQAQRMSALISQLLAFARADRGALPQSRERLDLGELGEMVALQISELASARSIRVETEIEPGLAVYGDETLLMRLLLNLMENGVKYGRDGGRLLLRLFREDASICGEVLDDGAGIARDDLARVWERFYQVDPARSAPNGGMGLGLPMVKTIVEAHGGSVDASSELGKGSAFRFRIPAAS